MRGITAPNGNPTESQDVTLEESALPLLRSVSFADVRFGQDEFMALLSFVKFRHAALRPLDIERL